MGVEFPGIAATFLEQEAKFADFGQDLQESVRKIHKFAAKFAEAGKIGWKIKTLGVRPFQQTQAFERALFNAFPPNDKGLAFAKRRSPSHMAGTGTKLALRMIPAWIDCASRCATGRNPFESGILNA